MTPLTTLWLPILLSAVAVFVASSVIHMASPWHKNDYAAPPYQDGLLDAMRPFAIPPGDYFLPRPKSGKEMKTPEFLEKMKKGPVVIMTVAPNGPFSMGRNLGLWFVYLVVVGAFAAWVSGRALPPGAPGARVMELSGVTAFLGYGAALWQMSIWYRRAWSSTIKSTVDGAIYALLTAGIFAWLWPR